MVRTFWALVHFSALSALFSPTSELKRLAESHKTVVLDMSLRQIVSEDSGYWDYALLMFYDEIVRSVMLSGLTSLSDFGWVERTAVLAAGGLNVDPTRSLLDMCRNVGRFFIMLGRNFILVCLLVTLASISHGWVFVVVDFLFDVLCEILGFLVESLASDDIRHNFFLVAGSSLLRTVISHFCRCLDRLSWSTYFSGMRLVS